MLLIGEELRADAKYHGSMILICLSLFAKLIWRQRFKISQCTPNNI